MSNTKFRRDESGVRRKVTATIDGIDYYEVKFPSTCAGCYESEDGHPDGDYPIHPKHKVPMGGGCKECRGRGLYIQRVGIPFDTKEFMEYVNRMGNP